MPQKNMKRNREAVDALKIDTSKESFNPDSDNKWEKVADRIDFSSKGSCTKDTTRMRQVLLKLKSGKNE
jgi:hypothetical protein